jgi:energy-coupling factor transport system permease protein
MFRPKILYQPADTFVHRLNPLVKLAWLIGLSAIVFLVPRMGMALGLLAGVLVLYPVARLRLWRDVRGIRLIAGTALLLFVLQALFNRRGKILFFLWPWGEGALPVTDEGVRYGVMLGARFAVLLVVSYLFVATTDPSALAYALMRAGLPYRYGFALITALRLAPVFEAESSIVYQAQLARGLRYDVRSPLRLLTLLRQFFFPLLVSALSKVDALAVSMEGRCFGKYPTRTFVRQARFGWGDAAALALLAVGVGALVVYWISSPKALL